MITLHTLGYPRIGARRELKDALEAFWAGRIGAAGLAAAVARLRDTRWKEQADAGIDLVPAGDLPLYDHVLDTSLLLGAVPRRFRSISDPVELEFAMARGATGGDGRLAACDMTKWFDTNYHYIVPELEPDQELSLHPRRLLDETAAAIAAGLAPKPVLVGPLTFLWIARTAGDGPDRPGYLERILPLYRELLALLAAGGARWVELDEPILALDLPEAWVEAARAAYARLAAGAPRPRILLAAYFGPLAENLRAAAELPVDGLHLDAVRGRADVRGAAALAAAASGKVLSLGVVDGRNVWRTDLAAALDSLEPVHDRLGERLWLAPSCSLLHVPVSLASERGLDPALRGRLAFAREKLAELAVLRTALERGRDAVRAELEAGAAAAARAAGRAADAPDPRVRSEAVRARARAVTPEMARRRAPHPVRARLQRTRFALPPFPTTTIGSFPQTAELRRARRALRRGEIDEAAYRGRIEAEIAAVIREQEAIGLDVLVHGEAERTDMVEYFAAQLEGFAVTENGWVQSYGSRCVKPPIIWADVERPRPMTVSWARFAQSLTAKPVKGMLTGPVTMLNWSFVRDDLPRAETALQIALALRDEVLDLERAGTGIIQVDEPALREGLPLRSAERPAYLEWAVRAFGVATAAVTNQTQIHTHMCYSEFAEIIEAIAALDADVITIEAARSAMELLESFRGFRYPNEIGPGVYDIHSPTVPSREEIEAQLERAAAVIDPDRLWVNPDCGLKTRGWDEVRPSLRNMVAAARALRAVYGPKAAVPAG